MAIDQRDMRPAGNFTIAADHPALAGHFPGAPVVPGVVLLDYALAQLTAYAPYGRGSGLRQAKFLRPVLPGQLIEVHWQEAPGGGALSLICLHGRDTVMTARVLREAPGA